MITIGITAFREGEFLRECWNSVLAQTSDDWEAIAVLDGNADPATRSIFREMIHPRLRKIELAENIGPYPARELIFENSAQDAVLYIDADDYFSPDAAGKVAALFADPAVAYGGVGAELFWPDGRTLALPGHPTTPEKLIRNGEFPGYLVFRKSTWLALGGYDRKLRRGKADFDFLLKILERNLPGKFIPDILLHKRERPVSVSRSYPHRMAFVHERIVANHPAIFADNDLRNHFLNGGYLMSAWNCFANGRMKRAACFARKGARLNGGRAYWPLALAHRLPAGLVRGMVKSRRNLGRFLRLLKPSDQP